MQDRPDRCERYPGRSFPIDGAVRYCETCCVWIFLDGKDCSVVHVVVVVVVVVVLEIVSVAVE